MKIKTTIFSVFILALLLIYSCRKKNADYAGEESFVPVLPEEPYDYPMSHNDHVATLGRVLFYDKSFSLNNSVSCASCHQQSKAFCDNLKFSTGLQDQQTGRNSPSIFARQGKMFWDGRAANMQDLVLRPIKNHVEMKFENVDALVEKISRIPYYQDLFRKAFGSVAIDSSSVKTALSQFLNNFRFSSNKFNRSKKKMDNLTVSENMGKDIFFGKGRCSRCHNINDDGTGSGYGSTMLSLSFNIGLDEVYLDRGVGDISKSEYDYGKFMTPVLLNVEYTAPYMHDGRFNTLEEVVEHYNSGLKNHPNLDVKLRDLGSLENLSETQLLLELDKDKNGKVDPPEMSAFPPVKLNLTSIEKKALVDFLKTLSDASIFTEVKFSDPFRLK